MREFTKNIREALVAGIRPDQRSAVNADVMFDLQGLVPTKFGLEEPEAINFPFHSSTNIDFPFPQLFVGTEMTLLCYATRIYLVDTTLSPWQYQLLNVYNKADQITQITAGGSWHFIDNGKSWYLFNGISSIYYTDEPTVNVKSRKAFLFEDSPITTGTHLNGRNFIGGIYPDKLLNDSFGFIYDNITDSPHFPADFSQYEGDLKFVMWSSIGGGDFPLWFFNPSLADTGTFDFGDDFIEDGLLDSLIVDRLKSNQLGFIPMPTQGDVLKLMPLGKTIIVYTTSGIFRLFPAVVDEYSTFGMAQISAVGIKGRGFVGGTDQAHFIIDSEGYLHSLTEQNFSVMGYRELFSSWEDCLISYSDRDNTFYFTDGNECFVYESGMGRSLDIIHSTNNYKGQQVAIVEATKNEDDEIVTDVLAVSHNIDFQVPGKKTITSIAVTGVGITHVAIDYRYDKNSDFKRTTFKPVNKEGNCYFRVNGLEFRVVAKGTKDNNVEIDYMQVRYQLDDNRFIRGINVNPNTA